MTPSPSVPRVVVVDLRIPFVRLVFFFVKAGLAVIPAAIILAAVLMVLSALIVALLGGDIDALVRRWTM
jgi:hypothetical protein